MRPKLLFFLRWLLLTVAVAALAGTASAGFLVSLDWVTGWREAHPWALAGLPLGGLLVGWAYYRFGGRAGRGTNLILEEIHDPRETVPLRLVPLVLGGTLLTHLLGGSAGREGTAVQMGGALADQLSRWLPGQPAGLTDATTPTDGTGPADPDNPKSLTADTTATNATAVARGRRLLLIAGLSAGFASVFGTPLAGAVFGLEVLRPTREGFATRWPAGVLSLAAAVFADQVTRAWGIHHTPYPALAAGPFSVAGLGAALLAGAAFGLAARAFVRLSHYVQHAFERVPCAPLRPVLGGALVAAAMWGLGTMRYAGLGIPVILEAFRQPLGGQDFALKLGLTALTLGSGFRGGEVTPLFFIGATLGSALAGVLPLPVSLLAGMGLVCVFAGAARTPLACVVLGMELFGPAAGVHLALACGVAYLSAGRVGIYSARAKELARQSAATGPAPD